MKSLPGLFNLNENNQAYNYNYQGFNYNYQGFNQYPNYDYNYVNPNTGWTNNASQNYNGLFNVNPYNEYSQGGFMSGWDSPNYYSNYPSATVYQGLIPSYSYPSYDYYQVNYNDYGSNDYYYSQPQWNYSYNYPTGLFMTPTTRPPYSMISQPYPINQYPTTRPPYNPYPNNQMPPYNYQPSSNKFPTRPPPYNNPQPNYFPQTPRIPTTRRTRAPRTTRQRTSPRPTTQKQTRPPRTRAPRTNPPQPQNPPDYGQQNDQQNRNNGNRHHYHYTINGGGYNVVHTGNKGQKKQSDGYNDGNDDKGGSKRTYHFGFGK